MSDLPGIKMILGMFAYDYVDMVEELPKAKQDLLNIPDYVFWVPEKLLIIDHVKNHTRVWERDSECHPGEGQGPVSSWRRPGSTCLDSGLRQNDSMTVDIPDDEYADLVKQMKEHIVQGDVFQIVPSRTFSLPCEDPLAAYQRLKQSNPSPYMFYVNAPDFTVFGSSPENFIRVSEDPKRIEISPIAGTRTRGIDLDADSRKEAELRLDIKEQAEHMMLVDLARNDIARVSKAGTRHVQELLTVDRYSHVMHLVSHVQGDLKDDLDALHAYQASLNMGTLVGAPKVKAAQILREVEKTKRGIYGGAVGYLDHRGNLNTAIMIRSAIVKDGTAYVRVGAGVVFDSDPAFEVQETHNKAKAVLEAIQPSASHPGAGQGLDAGLRQHDKKPSILLIDNFDSFTFNLESEFRELGCDVQVWRNCITVDKAMEIALAMPEPRLIVLSPGPGTPKDAGCCIELVQKNKGQVPMLGICMGHQVMIEALGGEVGLAEITMHGKSSLMKHSGAGVFEGFANPMPVARYHSLSGAHIPDELEVLATCGETVMAVQHKQHKMLGLQFHPESILTPEGSLLLQRILNWA